jgi:hypothetical protein
MNHSHWLIDASPLMTGSRIVFASLLFSQLVLAQAAQPAAAKTPNAARTNDLSGVWASKADAGASGMDGGTAVLAFSRELPLMTAWAKGKYDVTRQGTSGPFERARDEQDPHIHCLPYGIPRVFAVNQPFEIVQVPGRVLFLFEADHEVRRIYTDGRKPPEDAEATYMGHATGRWDRDTLVVDTLGLNELTWLDSIGHPHSDALHITERIRRVDRNTLEINFTFNDPKAYVKPWGGTKLFELKPEWEISEELTCEDHLREYHIPKLLRGDRE